MAHKRFGDFVLGSGGGPEFIQLETKCLALYESLVDGRVNPDEFEDFCSQLGNPEFVEEVKLFFPALRSHSDEHLDNSSSYVDRMRAAAKQHIPEPYISPAPHDEALLLVRKYLHTVAEFVSRADLSTSVKIGLYLGFDKLFEVAGAATPGYVTDYLEGKEGSTDLIRHKMRVIRKSKDKFSLKQPLGLHTDTGVINGGSTCYQNAVFRLLLSSEAVMSLVTAQNAVDVFLSAEKEDDLDFHVFDLVLEIAGKNFVASKDCLRKFWNILAKSSTSPGEQPWTTGRQQDPAELITKFFLQDLRSSFLIPAWAHDLKTKDDCLACHRRTNKIGVNNLIYPLHLSSDKISETPTSHDLDFVDLFTNSLIVPEIAVKNCGSCGDNMLHSRTTDLLQVQERDASDHLPEIVVQLVRFGAAGRKVRQKVALPSVLFALNGRHCLYYMKYVAVHIGSQLSQGHYFSFERPSLSEAAQQQNREDESEEANTEPALTKFNKWTRYEDNRKTEDQKFSDIESEYGKDAYLCRLVPVCSGDIIPLISVDEIIASVRSTIVDSCSDFRGHISEALDTMSGSTSEAIADSLRMMFRKIMHLSHTQKVREVISDGLLLQQLATTFHRELPTAGRSNHHLTIFLNTWLMEEWKAYTHASQESLSPFVRVEDVANDVLRQMLTPHGIADLITSLGRSIVDRNARRHAQETQNRLLNTEYETIKEQQQQQQALLAAAHAERAAAEEAARQRETNLDDDDEDEANLQLGIRLSFLGQRAAPGTHGSDDATSSQLIALQQKHDELRKTYDEWAEEYAEEEKRIASLQKNTTRTDELSSSGSIMAPLSEPKTGHGTHIDVTHRPSPRRTREDSHPRMPHPNARMGAQSPYEPTTSGSQRRGGGRLARGRRPDREHISSPDEIGQGTSKDPFRLDGSADEPNIPSDDGRTDEPSVSSRVAPSKDQSISSRGDEKTGDGKPGESNTIRQKLKSTFSILDLRKSRRRNRRSTSKQRVTSGLFGQPEESSTSGNFASAIPRRESKGDLVSKTDAPKQPNTIRRSQSFLNLFGRSEKQAKSKATTAQVGAGNLQLTLHSAETAREGTLGTQSALQRASTAQEADSSTHTTQQLTAETGTRRVPFRERPFSFATVIRHQLAQGQRDAEKDKNVEMEEAEANQ